MSFKTLLTSLATAALLAPAVAGAAGPASDAKSGAPAVPSFAGEWRLDRAKSTFPRRPEGGRRGRGMGGDGMWGGGRGGGMGAEGSGRMRGGREAEGSRRGGPMRSTIRIDQVDGLLTIADSSGVAFEEIAYEDPAPPRSGIRRLGGEWNGTSLVALGDGPMGGAVTETYTLQDGGKTLEVRTRILPPEDRPAMDFVRVYRRVEPAK